VEADGFYTNAFTRMLNPWSENPSLIWLANEGSEGNQDTKVSIRYTFQRDTIECLLEVKEDSFCPVLKMDEPFIGGS